MFELQSRCVFSFSLKEAKDRVDKAAFQSVSHAAASIRKTAIESIKITKTVIGYMTTTNRKGKQRHVKIYEPSKPGTPVHSHQTTQFVRRGIKYEAGKLGAIIGFTRSVYGDVMQVHEFGGERKGQTFVPRPVMRPALMQNIPRFASEWRGSISR